MALYKVPRKPFCLNEGESGKELVLMVAIIKSLHGSISSSLNYLSIATKLINTRHSVTVEGIRDGTGMGRIYGRANRVNRFANFSTNFYSFSDNDKRAGPHSASE
jgi:hypothetical protein